MSQYFPMILADIIGNIVLCYFVEKELEIKSDFFLVTIPAIKIDRQICVFRHDAPDYFFPLVLTLLENEG